MSLVSSEVVCALPVTGYEDCLVVKYSGGKLVLAAVSALSMKFGIKVGDDIPDRVPDDVTCCVHSSQNVPGKAVSTDPIVVGLTDLEYAEKRHMFVRAQGDSM